MVNSSKVSYQNLFKATSLFGGVQIVVIIISLVKGKFVATLLGVNGMGISSLLTSPINMIITIAGMGVTTSSIRNISKAFSTKDLEKLSRTIYIFKVCLICGCILGSAILLISAKYLSQFSFGNTQYTFSFMLLTLMLIPSVLSSGNISILQGTGRIKDTAKLTFFGSMIGLISSVPLYYLFGIVGIVPAMILPAWLNYLIGLYYVKRNATKSSFVPVKEVLGEGIDMVKLGFILVISVLLGQVSVYFLNIFISITGNINDVGLMTAALSMTTQAVAMIFYSMSSDYYPRLCAISDDRKKMNITVNQQGEILLLIAFPVLIAFSVSAPIIIKLLLSHEFHIISGFIRVLAFGMIFKTASYAIGYISMSKGDKKTFFILEALWGNLFNLILNLTGYYFWGLPGLAISFCLGYIVYYLLVSLVTYYKYGYRSSYNYRKISVIVFCISTAMLFLSILASPMIVYVGGILLFTISSAYSFHQLDSRIGISDKLKSLLKKN